MTRSLRLCGLYRAGQLISARYTAMAIHAPESSFDGRKNIMPKDHTNGSGTGATTQPTIHLILQGKGGVGKSVVASWLAEFLMGRGQPVRCIDGDPVNRSLGQYQALAAEKL